MLKRVKEFVNSLPFPRRAQPAVEITSLGIVITAAKVIASSEASFVRWYCEARGMAI